MSKIHRVSQWVNSTSVDIIVTHDLDATLNEATAAYETYLAESDLSVYRPVEVRYLSGDADYGSTYSVFTHRLRA